MEQNQHSSKGSTKIIIWLGIATLIGYFIYKRESLNIDLTGILKIIIPVVLFAGLFWFFNRNRKITFKP